MMYTTTTASGVIAATSEALDSKYTVADILSSMASGDALTPTYSGAVPTLGSEVSSAISMVTAPLLTPTTLANLEQTFHELQSVPTTTTVSHLQPFNRTTESGFVPPVINMVKQEYVDYGNTEYGNIGDPDWLPSGAKKARVTTASAGIPQSVIRPTFAMVTSPAPAITPRRHTGPRPARDDSVLTHDELRKRGVRRERNKQAAAKCRQRRVDLTNTLLNETEDLEDEKSGLESDIQSLQQQKEQLEFLLEAHKPLCHAKKNGQASLVKTEKVASTCISAPAPIVSRHHGISAVTSRPNTLPIPIRTNVTRSPVTEATGVSISTPSSGVVFNFGLESMMDGHTGLTPLTGGPSCASQVQRSSSDSSPSDALSSPTTLMAL